MKTLALLLAAALAPLTAANLVRSGKSAYSICLALDAPPPDRRAAAELQRFLAEMSGARLPITADCANRKPHVLLGSTASLKETLGPEEYIIRTRAQDLIIAGGAPRGTLYGVYAFLDRLGCRWFTRDVSRIPKRPTIDITALDFREHPAFEYREPFITEAFDLDWAARNRTNGNHSKLDASTGGKIEYYPFVHSFNELLPPEKYFKDHPEYFSLIDGARRAERSQLCLTNPEVLRIATAKVREWIRDHPTAKIFSVSQNDWEGWCECDRCRAVEREEGNRHSGPILRFVNALASDIAKTNPDKLIDTLAYWYTEDPPAKVRPVPNVRIRLCPIGVCESHAYQSCPRSAYFVRNLKAWSAITSQLYIWHYNTNFAHYLTPFPDFDELAADIPLYKNNGVVGLFMQGGYAPGGGSEAGELRAYVMARQLWNTAVDTNREIDDFMQGVYGPAAKPMRQYFDRLHQEVRNGGSHIWIFNLPEFSPGFLSDAAALFNAAFDSAHDPAIRRRIEKARIPLEYVELINAREYSVNGTQFAPPDLAGWQRRLHSFAARLRTFGIQSIREGRMLEEDETAADAMRPHTLLPVSNGNWSLAVAPTLGGRIIRMSAGPRELLRIPRPGENGYPDLAGEIVQAFPDFPLRAWPIKWTSAETAKNEVALTGTCDNGLALHRRIRLEGDWVATRVVARNTSSAPLDVVLQSRAEFEPGDIDSARIQYSARSGAAIDRAIITPGEQPNGSETSKEENVPAGQWTLQRANLPAITSQFNQELVQRTTLNWTAKGGSRVSLAVWSKKRTLAPGESLELEVRYR